MKVMFPLFLLLTVVAATEEESLSRYLKAQSHVTLDPKTVELKDDSDQYIHDRRSFVRYESSQWEKIWIDNVNTWANDETICEELNTSQQMKYVHDFLTLLCSARYEAPYDNWCIIDDEFRPLWYNTAIRDAYDLSWVRPVPDGIALTSPPQPIIPGPEHEHIVSKFIFRDDTTGELYTEYIEPLVSHLRFPLTKCATFLPNNSIGEEQQYHWHQITFAGYLIPPPPGLKVRKKYYFDAGASKWNDPSGSSLKFFHNMWLRSGNAFDEIFAYEKGTTPADFYKTVPEHLKDHVHYQQCAVASSQGTEKVNIEPFIPSVIKRQATPADYVVFKLDIDQPTIEHGAIDFIINDPNNFIDEIAWEHHISGNYLMEEWGPSRKFNHFTLRESYELFLKLRMKGIRAHSWI